jgi:serine/threonine-protein kinase
VIPRPPEEPVPAPVEEEGTDPSLVAPKPGPRVDPLVGKVIDQRYRLVSLIARGGMGKVYKAEQTQLGRTVAIKLLEIGQGEQDAEFRQRFLLEASTCARLTHPNTVRIFDYGQTWDDILFIAMEYLDGRTLHHVLKTEPPLAAARVIRILRQVCASLREAHGLGLVHRDLKPGNVVLCQHGDDSDFVRVLDFGLVKQLRSDDELTTHDAVVGSPSYMSPEQIRGDRLDQRSDVYSLGVILYAALVGKAPFSGENAVNVLMAHLHQAPPEIPADRPALLEAPTLGWLAQACLAKDRTQRVASMDDVLRVLKQAERECTGERPPMPNIVGGRVEIDGEGPPSIAPPSAGPLAPSPPPAEGSISTFISRQRVPILAGSLVVILAGLALVLLVAAVIAWPHLSPSRAPAPAPVPAAVSAPSPAPPAPARVRLTSVPRGARVTREGQSLGAAPMDVVLPASGRTRVLVEADGYEAREVELVEDDAYVQVVLKPTPAVSSPARPRAAPAPEAAPGPAAPPPPEVTPAPVPEPTAPPESTPPKTGSDLRDPWARP